MKYSVVHSQTGVIIRSNIVHVDNVFDIPEELKRHEIIVVGDYLFEDHYYDTINKEMKDRPANLAWIDKNKIQSDGKDALILSGVPDAAKVNIFSDDVQEMVSDLHIAGNDIEITTDTSGKYRIYMSCWPEKDKVLWFTAI